MTTKRNRRKWHRYGGRDGRDHWGHSFRFDSVGRPVGAASPDRWAVYDATGTEIAGGAVPGVASSEAERLAYAEGKVDLELGPEGSIETLIGRVRAGLLPEAVATLDDAQEELEELRAGASDPRISEPPNPAPARYVVLVDAEAVDETWTLGPFETLVEAQEAAQAVSVAWAGDGP